MDIINASLNPDHIETLKEKLYKADLKFVCHKID